MAKADMKQEARELYLKGHTYKQIVNLLHVAKSSVSLWCRDLVPAEKQRYRHTAESRGREKAKRVYVPRGPRKRNGPQLLTIEQVVAERQRVRLTQKMETRINAKKLGVSLSTLSMAIRGLTFKDADAIEPPITANLTPPPPINKKPEVAQEYRDALIAMRKEDPHRWIYTRLAAWLGEQTGESYSHAWLRSYLLNEDPKLIDVKTRKKVADKRKQSLTEDHLIEEALKLRRSDPANWSYGAIGKWLSLKTNRRYAAGPVATLLRNRDPSITVLESIKRVRPKASPSPAKPKRVLYDQTCVVCDREFKSLKPDAEICFRKSCHKVIDALDHELE